MALAAAVALVVVICLGRTGQDPSATPSEREVFALLAEAEAFARKATETQPGNWRALETLAAVLLRGGRTDEGALI